ncbi:MAG: hypothetical protein NZL98_05855 [Anaerolineales bacterium]|nr:hypothetical protein [Anaerolineales bacterium]MDW8227663.1 hypothetical protein [Anaerolineales bacterium]
MNELSSRDLIQLSAYLDGELRPAEAKRLEQRLAEEDALQRALEDLRQTRALLRQMPQRHPPRNFTLKPRLRGLRPPFPRTALALSWASLAILLVFFIALGSRLFGDLSIASSSPMAVARPMEIGGGTEEPMMSIQSMEGTLTPTPEIAYFPPAETASPAPEMRAMSLEESSPVSESRLPSWWFGAPIVSLLLLGIAFGLRRAQLRAFQRRFMSRD